MRIKELRLSKGLTIKQLSVASNVAVGYLSDLENGKRKNPSMNTLKLIADALGVTIFDLLGFNGEKKDKKA